MMSSEMKNGGSTHIEQGTEPRGNPNRNEKDWQRKGAKGGRYRCLQVLKTN